MKKKDRNNFRAYAESVMELVCSGDAHHYDDVALDWRTESTVEGMERLAKESGMLDKEKTK